jgi:hypothetical protein
MHEDQILDLAHFGKLELLTIILQLLSSWLAAYNETNTPGAANAKNIVNVTIMIDQLNLTFTESYHLLRMKW